MKILVIMMGFLMTGCGQDILVTDINKMISVCDNNNGAISINVYSDADDQIFRIKYVTCGNGATFKRSTVIK